MSYEPKITVEHRYEHDSSSFATTSMVQYVWSLLTS